MNILRQFTSVSSMLSALTPALLLAAAALAAPTAARGQSLPPEARSEELISLKFSDAPIEQVLDFYSQLTGRTLLQMPNINATITLRSQGMLSKDECLHAIESVLVMRNISLVPMGEKFLKVVQADQAAQVGMKIGTEDPDKPFAESDQMATQLIKLSHVAPSEVVGVIQSLLQGFGKIQVLERNNAILVTATSANILRTLELLENSVEVVVFPKAYEHCKHLLVDEQPVMVCGRVDSEQGFKIIAEEVYPLAETMQRFTEHVGLHLPTVTLQNGRLKQVAEIVDSYPGDVPLMIWLLFPGGEKVCVSAGRKHYVAPSEDMIRRIQKLIGENSVKLSVKREACLRSDPRPRGRQRWAAGA